MLVRVCTHRRSVVERVGMFNPECAMLEDWEWLIGACPPSAQGLASQLAPFPVPYFPYRHNLVGPLKGHLSHQRAAADYRARIAYHGQFSLAFEGVGLRHGYGSCAALARYAGHVATRLFRASPPNPARAGCQSSGKRDSLKPSPAFASLRSAEPIGNAGGSWCSAIGIEATAVARTRKSSARATRERTDQDSPNARELITDP